MAIINCPNCQGKLRFPDDLPPRKVKCPTCGNSFLAGPKGPIGEAATKPSEMKKPEPAKVEPKKPEPAKVEPKKKVEEDFEVVDDKPPRSRRRDKDDEDDEKPYAKRRDDDDNRDRKRRGREDDDNDQDRKRRRVDEDEDRNRKRRDRDDDDDRPRSRRRDEDDDDRPRSRRRDRDDDDDDRPRSKQRGRDDDDDRPRSKRRGRDDDNEKSRPRSNKAQWDFARKGLALINYGYWCQIGSYGALLVVFLLQWMGASESILLALASIPGLINWILSGVGIGFLVAGPRRGNMLGLAIALAAVALVHLGIVLYVAFGESAGYGYLGARSSVNWLIFPTAFIECAVMVLVRVTMAWILFAGIFEIARHVLFTLYLKDVSRTGKNRDASGKSTMLMVALPSAAVVSILVVLLGFELLKEAQPGRTMGQIIAFLFVTLKLGAYAFIHFMTITTANDISDKTYNRG